MTLNLSSARHCSKKITWDYLLETWLNFINNLIQSKLGYEIMGLYLWAAKLKEIMKWVHSIDIMW